MKDNILEIAGSLMKKEMTLKEIVDTCGGATYKNFYTVLMKLEKEGFLVYEESENKSGSKCRYGILGTVKGSRAEAMLGGNKCLVVKN